MCWRTSSVAVAIGVLISTTVAAQPTPRRDWTLAGGVGITLDDVAFGDGSNSVRNGGMVFVDWARRYRPATWLGVHVAVSRVTGTASYEFDRTTYHYSYVPVEVGFLAQQVLVERVWLWGTLGLVRGRHHDESRTNWTGGLMLGAGIAVDLYKVGVFAATTVELGVGEDVYRAASFGLYYRYL